MNAALIVFVKECRESLRDRRVLINALLLGPLLTPLLFLMLMQFVVNREIERAEKPLPVAVIGAANAPNLVDALRELGLSVRMAPDDAATAVRQREQDLVLRIPDDYAQRWRAGQPAELELYFDSSRQEAQAQAQRLERMIQQYTTRVGSLRLLARGIAPSVATPVVVALRDQATPEARGAVLLGMVPYFLVMTALLGGMWLAIDCSAGERERQSLEPLLINPVSTAQILAGKWAATAVFSVVSILLGLLAFREVSLFMPGDEPAFGPGLGMNFVLVAGAHMLPLALFLAIAQIWLASFARSFREAQTYLGLAQLVPLIPSVFLMVAPNVANPWWQAVPILGQQMAVLAALRGEAPALGPGLLGAVTTLLAAGLVYWQGVRLYRSERVAIYA